MELVGYALGALYVVAAVAMFLDVRARRQQGAQLAALSGTVTAVGRRVSQQGSALEALGHTVARIVVPPDARVTAAPAPRGAPPTVAVLPVNVARELEVAELPEPPVDDRGDRAGVNPGDAIPDDVAAEPMSDPAVVRQRAELAEDAREAERARRAAVPTLFGALTRARRTNTEADVDRDARTTIEVPRVGGDDVDDADERTVVGTRADIFAGGPIPVGPRTSEAQRILPEQIAAAKEAWGGRTLLSQGVARQLPTPATGGDPVEQRHELLCGIARVARLPVDHCCGHDCTDGRLCTCDCDACARTSRLLAQARCEVLGPPAVANDGAPSSTTRPAAANDRKSPEPA